MMKMFEGVITPIVTPFNRDYTQTINFDATKQLIDWLINHGIDGLFLLGTNGEFHVLNDEEKIYFIKEVVKIVNHRVPIYSGAGACSTKDTIRLAQAMEAAGSDCLSIITPYFIRPSDEEIYQHYSQIAHTVNIPILLYNIPKLTGCNISAETIKRLVKDNPNILGIKDSSGDIENLKSYLEVAKNTNLKVLIGSDSKISEAYHLGVNGCVAGTSNVIVDTIVALWKSLKDNDTVTAQKLQKDIDVLRSVLKIGTIPSMMKRSIELSSIAPVGPARKPVLETNTEQDKKIKEMLAYYHLDTIS